ncbi:ATP-binding protein [Oleomonas cavernae]|uniref:ATP-binding protein n=1 Tax=Oleomonas cavernae TaxID=2320859 RepID=UPI0038CF3C0F
MDPLFPDRHQPVAAEPRGQCGAGNRCAKARVPRPYRHHHPPPCRPCRNPHQRRRPGVPEKVRDRIFDPFFTTKEVGKGTGQGLAIARDVVESKHGGTIALDLSVPLGACFVVRLPITDAAP